MSYFTCSLIKQINFKVIFSALEFPELQSTDGDHLLSTTIIQTELQPLFQGASWKGENPNPPPAGNQSLKSTCGEQG